MLEAGMKPAYCAKILGHSVQTFLSAYARFIDADAEQAAIWATVEYNRSPSGAKVVTQLIRRKKSIKSIS